MAHQGVEGVGVSLGTAKRGWGSRATAAILVLGLTACSSLPDLPDYANPAEWYRSSTDMVGNWFESDEPKIESATATANESKLSKNAGEKYPNLSTVPAKPEAKSSGDARAKLKNQLSADRANARYTDAKSTATAEPALRRASAVAPKAPAAEQVARLPSSTFSGKRSSLWPNAPAPGSSAVAAPTSARVGRPVVSPSRTVKPMPKVVAPRIISAVPKADTMSASATTAPIAPPAPDIPPKFTLTPPSAAQITPLTSASEAAPVFKLTPPSGYTANANAGGQQPMLSLGAAAQGGAAGVINFKHGSSRLSSSDLARLRALAKEAINVGAYIRVVGHASMRTRDMDPFEHTLANFNVSLKRANVVASALIDIGVPAEQLIVDAVGDTQPLFSEAMPSGEQANRRTEVYLES
jgi:outer membrane protein OmpA-like peptidoglycan-associated protein